MKYIFDFYTITSCDYDCVFLLPPTQRWRQSQRVEKQATLPISRISKVTALVVSLDCLRRFPLTRAYIYLIRCIDGKGGADS